MDLSEIAPGLATNAAVPSASPPIVINDWTARELAVTVRDPLALDYYVWREPGHLETRSADFLAAAIGPVTGAGAARCPSPAYPGICHADTLGELRAPCPLELRR